MHAAKLKAFLDGEGIKYVSLTHSRAYTAQEIAASAHIPGKELAKTVMVKIGGELAMAVLPASHRIDFDRLKEAAGSKEVELAQEREFQDKFPDCEVGAMPPFGNLYGVNVYAATSLTKDEEIAFNAGSHTELVRLSFEDYQRLVKPKIADFSVSV